jgi:hypothetical protein
MSAQRPLPKKGGAFGGVDIRGTGGSPPMSYKKWGRGVYPSALLKKEKNSLVAGGRFELPTFGL